MGRRKQAISDEEAVVLMESHIVYHARRLGRTCRVVEDLEQEGRIGAVQAARRYDAGCGVMFTTYATQRVVGRMLDYLRAGVSHLNRRQVASGMTVSMRTIHGREEDMQVAGPDVWEQYDREIRLAAVNESVGELPAVARKVVFRRIMEGHRRSLCGLTAEQVVAVEAGAVRFLRGRLAGVMS